jgi:hypothetical protein
MEGDATTIATYVIGVLQAYGLAGLVMGAMGWIIRALWKDNIFLRNTLFETGNKAIEANSAMAQAVAQLRTDILTANAANGRGRARGE